MMIDKTSCDSQAGRRKVNVATRGVSGELSSLEKVISLAGDGQIESAGSI